MGIPDTPTARKALKVAELRECLASVGLDTTGTKPVLLERLEEVSVCFQSGEWGSARSFFLCGGGRGKFPPTILREMDGLGPAFSALGSSSIDRGPGLRARVKASLVYLPPIYARASSLVVSSRGAENDDQLFFF